MKASTEGAPASPWFRDRARETPLNDGSANERDPPVRPRSVSGRSLSVGSVLLCAAMAAAVAAWGLSRGAQLDYDGAHYLERGLYHAEQVELRGRPALVQLPWSLSFEAPKPPLFHGLLASLALALGRHRLDAVIFLGLALPLFGLFLAVIALSRREGGARAGFLGLALLVGMPVVLRMGTSLMVETLLGLFTTLGCWTALRALDRVGWREPVASGGALAGAALTKLTGVVLVGVAVACAAVGLARSRSLRAATRYTLLAGAVAICLAGPWYLRNGTDALDFASYSAKSWAHHDVGAAWSRPFRLVVEAIGLPAAILAGLGAMAARRRTATPRLGWIALVVAGFSALAVVTPPQFEPRFWMPALAPLAAWAGVELSRWSSTRVRRGIVVTGLGLMVAFAIAGEARRPPSWRPWPVNALLDRQTQADDGGTLCNLGENRDWNRYKLRLSVQTAAQRPRRRVIDLLHEVDPGERLAVLGRCAIVFRLDPFEIPAERPQIRQNSGLEELRAEMDRAGTHARDRASEQVFAGGPRVEVWRRL